MFDLFQPGWEIKGSVPQPQRYVNPDPAEPEYALSLQTV